MYQFVDVVFILTKLIYYGTSNLIHFNGLYVKYVNNRRS